MDAIWDTSSSASTLEERLAEKSHHRISQKERDANGKRWYKDRIREFVSRSFSGITGYGNTADYSKMRINYDLFNNILNVQDLMYVVQPYGSKLGETPAKMVNRDIVSTKIKSLLGMEIKRPFNWKVIAVNEEAITRKQAEENKRNTEFVVSQIMKPLRMELEMQAQQQAQGRQLTPEEQNQIMAGIEEELKKKTPDEVRKYMIRAHKDPAEVLNEQILNYLIPNLKIKNKFNKGFKHGLLSALEAYYVGIVNGEPYLKVCNSLFLDCDRSDEYDNINEGEWAVYKHMMTPSQIVAQFADELTEAQIDIIYSQFGKDGGGYGTPLMTRNMDDYEFTFRDVHGTSSFATPVYHCEFKSLRKIKFLTYFDLQLGLQEMIVNDSYVLKPDAGDISLEEMYIPELHEGYYIGGTDIFLGMRPVPGQHKDLSNLHVCKLSYCGGFYDNMNSCPTAVMDRIKEYQYYYNIIMYRVEMLMVSDRGKKLLMNIRALPKSAGIDLDKWLYYMDNLGIGFFDTHSEGNKKAGFNLGSAGDLAKEIDMSMVSQINRYIELADYIDLKCGQAIGVPKQVEGEISPTDAVTNVKQVIVQSSNVLEPIFDFHNIIKGEVLNMLMEKAKVAYSIGKPKKLAYIMDDMSMHLLTVDQELLDNNTCGIFVANSGKAADVKQAIEQLAHAAVQNQAIELSDVVKVIKTEGINEAEELLEVAEQKKRESVQEQATAIEQLKAQEAEKARAFEREKWAHEESKEVKIQKMKSDADLLEQVVLSAGFNEDKDMNDNSVPDILEIAQQGIDASIKSRELDQEQMRINQKQQEIDNKKSDDKEKNKLKEKEIAAKNRKTVGA